jgi:hypothetical protein
MTHKVLASTLHGRDFKREVSSFHHELTEWKRHETQAKIDDKRYADDPTLNPLARRRSFPHPNAHPDVMKAITEDGQIDYEIVDDSPSAEEVLHQKKVRLFDEITRMENAAAHAVLPIAKRRLQNLKKFDLLNEKEPSKDQLKELEKFQATDEKLARINRIGAQAQADIDDLTTKNIDKWLAPSFEV